jgi:hypothetical protein
MFVAYVEIVYINRQMYKLKVANSTPLQLMLIVISTSVNPNV